MAFLDPSAESWNFGYFTKGLTYNNDAAKFLSDIQKVLSNQSSWREKTTILNDD